MKVLCLAALLCGVSVLTAGTTQALALNAGDAAGVGGLESGGEVAAANPMAADSGKEIHGFAKKKSPKTKKKKGSTRSKSSSQKSELEKAWSKVPDHTEPSVASALKCSACIAAAYEIHHGLTVMDQFRHGACDRYELFETMESSCPRLIKDYGLFAEKRSPAEVAEDRKKAREAWTERQAKALADAEERAKEKAAEGEESAGGALKPEPQPYEELPATLAENYILEFRSSTKFPTVLRDRWVKPLLSSYCGEIVDRHEKAILDGFKGVDYPDFTRQLCIEWEGACEGAPAPPEEEEDGDEGTCSGAPPSKAGSGGRRSQSEDDDEEMPEVEDIRVQAE